MFSILQARRLRGNEGEPLPYVFNAFESKKIQFRRGQEILVVAAPGTGKSALALTYAIKSGLSAMYFSPDSGSFTQVQRSYSITTGEDMSEAENFAREKSDDHMSRLGALPLRFNFEASPSLAEIERDLAAFEEVFGEYPALMIVDNITNVRSGIQDNDNDPFSGLEGLLDYLHSLARETQTCVIGLHHVNGPYNDGDKPIPLSGIKGQVGRVPEMVLTVFRSGPDRIGVSVVKNRGNYADPSGETFAELVFDGETMTIGDPGSQASFPVPEQDQEAQEIGF